MSPASSVSKSRVVSLKPAICSSDSCINLVAKDSFYCTLHDTNPLFPVKQLTNVPVVKPRRCSCFPFIYTRRV